MSDTKIPPRLDNGDMEGLFIEQIPLSQITPYESNAKNHGETDVEAIAASIREFGFLDPVGVWGESNLIVEGHGRVLAAEKLGMDAVPCIRLDRLTDAQRRAYALAHNKTAELSGWDFSALEKELEELENKFDMVAFGFAEGSEGLDVDDPDFLQDTEITKKKTKTVICPHCGKEFEV